MSTKIATIGERDVILPFKAIGAEVFPVLNVKDAHEILERLIKEDFGIILITDDLLPHIRDLLVQTKGTAVPCIVPIPGSKGSSGFALNEMRELIKKAVGVDIMK
ncbi:MAG: V-type ATP synthase subunit F [bacterium]|nr:V-type ATP synthase subunit F [bacterium]